MDDLLEKLDTLEGLIQLLPDSLPLKETGTSLFGLDSDDLIDIGIAGALNRCFEINWGMKAYGFRITERGDKLSTTIDIFRDTLNTMGPTDDRGLVGIWIDMFIKTVSASLVELRTATRQTSAASTTGSTSTVLSVPSDQCTAVPATPAVSSTGTECAEPPVQSRRRPVSRTLAQSKLSFSPISAEAYAEQERTAFERLGDRMRHERAKEMLRQKKEEEFKRSYDAERKRIQRFRMKQEARARGQATRKVIEIEESDSEPVTTSADSMRDIETNESGLTEDASSTPLVLPASESSRVHQELAKRTWSAPDMGHRRAIKQKKLTKAAADIGATPPPVATYRMNWQQYPYWLKIMNAQIKVAAWSPTEIVKFLRLTDPELFATLHVATLAKWITGNGSGGKTWSPEVLKRAKAGKRVGITAQSKTLADHPLIISDAVAQLRALRLSGVAVQGPLVMTILRAHILHKAPQLLAPGSRFTLSSSWVHRFIQDVLNWSSRKSTRAARKVPPNGADLCELTFLRIAFAIRFHNIKPSMIVNADQAGVLLMPSGKQTYEVKGSKDVPVHAHDEKRQMTIVVASSLDGKMLPFQSVWGGSSDTSLPSKSAPRRSEADDIGFVYAHGDTRHWSSRDTTKKWILEVLNPFLERQCAEAKPPLPDNEKALLLIDVWPVHIAKKSPDDFLPWIKATHKNIIVIFVPGGYFLVGSATRKLIADEKADEILLPTDLPTLRNASIAWLVDAYWYLQERPDIIKKAWEKCEANGWNLSYESLTSSAALEHLEKVMSSNREFAAEFAHLDVVSGNLEEESTDAWVAEGHDDDLALDPDVLAAACVARAPPSQPGSQSKTCSKDLHIDVGSDDEFVDPDNQLADIEDVEDTVPQAKPTAPTSNVPSQASPAAPRTPSLMPTPHTLPASSPGCSTENIPSIPPTSILTPPSSLPSELQHAARPPEPTETSETPDAPTYLADVAVVGGANHTIFCTEEQLRVTDKRGSKKAAKSASASGSKPAAARKKQSDGGSGQTQGVKRKQVEDSSGSQPQKLTIRIRPRPSGGSDERGES
ncbi:hypothetical protein VTO73DRAFT_4520 [Trametes versicolor]